ncbi:hypothetical protein [Streptosporangium sp. CA-115845]|uniref:hypothetical protein n=1 Tax=Streptosporangium sp. CA-115845 TaxID=3240071 RepID=UPI003D8C8169
MTVSPYARTWPQRLADGAPFLGGAVLAVGEASWADPLWISLLITGVGFGLIGFGLEHCARYRRQRNTYRRLLVGAIRDCAQHEGRDDRFEHLPGDVVAEAFHVNKENRRG